MTTLVSGGGVPVGAILPFGGTIAPEGFLIADGSLLNRNDFADLFAAIGTGWGTSSAVDFRIPTTQGLLLRGRANGSGFDPDRASRTAIQTGSNTGDNVGSYQSNRFGSHNHAGSGSHNHTFQCVDSSNTSGGAGVNGPLDKTNSAKYGGTYSTSTSSVSIAAQGGNQTVGNNVAVNFIIKI